MRFFILIFAVICYLDCNAQAKLAFIQDRDNQQIPDLAYFRNLAILSDVIIKIKGVNWYEENIIKNCYGTKQERAHLVCHMKVDYLGNVQFEFPDYSKNDSLKALMKSVEDFIISNHIIFYQYNTEVSKILKSTNSKDLISNTIKQYIRKSQSPYFINITYPWICMHQLYSRKRYEYYVADMNKKGFKPLGITGWIKMKIKQDLAEPIKSSLDYGITNDDFLLNKNRIKP